MIVRLTARQIDAVREAFANSPKAWATEWLDAAELLPGHALSYDVDMPAIGWLNSLQLLLELTIGPRGGHRKDVADSAIRAKHRIASALHLYALHPALFKMSIYGKSTEVIPAWALKGAKEGDRFYDIFPVHGAEFIHLIPEAVGQLVTWHPVHTLELTDLSLSSLQLSNHVRFVQGAQPDERASARPG